MNRKKGEGYILDREFMLSKDLWEGVGDVRGRDGGKNGEQVEGGGGGLECSEKTGNMAQE